MEKNVAGKWTVFAFGDPDHANPGEAVTGDAANITANIRIDGGAANAVDDTNPTELEDGYYVFDITATESNGDLLTLCPASSTANVIVIGVPGALWTRPANFNDLAVTATDGRVDVGEWLGTAVTANDLAVDSTIGARTEGSRTALDIIRDVGMLVESQRGAHTHQPIGNIYYVSPNDGATYASGARGGISDPLLTIQDCHDNLVTDSNHDTIVLLADASAGATTHTESSTTTISKRYCFIRGPGRDFIITRTGNGDTINITAEGVELSGVQINTAATGTGRGIDTTGDFTYIHNCWINATRGDGIRIDQAENCRIMDNTFQDTGAGGAGDGLEISGAGSSASNNNVIGNIFSDVQGDAIKQTGGTIDSSIIMHNIIHGSSSNGINVNDGTNTTVCQNTINDSGANGIIIAAGSTDAYLVNNYITKSTTSDINDSGTTTQDFNNVEWAKHSIATETRLAELDAANMPADIDAILVDTGTTLPGTLTTIDGKIDTVDTNVDAILVDTAEIGVAGAGLTNINLPNQTMDITGNITGNLSGSVGSVTGNVDGNVTGSVGSNLELGPAEVNAEVVDALSTDTYAEPGQEAPGATISLAAKIGYIYKAWRNRSTQTSTTYSLYNDDATTVDQKSTVSDNGTTADKGEVGTGP